jgi:hypothetical protein
MPRTGGAMTKVNTGGGSVREARISSTDDIAFLTSKSRELMLASLSTPGSPEMLTQLMADGTDKSGLQFSPDGLSVAYTAVGKTEPARLDVVVVAGGALRILFTAPQVGEDIRSPWLR